MAIDSIKNEGEVFWNDVVAGLKKNLSKESLDLWIKPIKVKSFMDNVLELEIPSKFFKEKLEDSYKGMIEVIASELANKKIDAKTHYGQKQ